MKLRDKQNEFEKQYTLLFDEIYCYVLYRITDKNDAEDIVSEVFIIAYQKLDSFNPGLASLKTWLFSIAKRKVIDYWRKKKFVIDFKESFEPLQILTVSGNSMQIRIDDDLFVHNIFSQLKPELKTLFALRYIDDLSYEEIAALTNKKVPSIRKIFSRIHLQLRNELKNLIDHN